LAERCPTCGTARVPGARFCGSCGTRFVDGGGEGAATPRATNLDTSATERGKGGIERRMVSVLFADLVGFTATSESADPEDVREFLTRYFEATSQVIDRYGGSVEK